ncbi:kinesin-like protein KIF13B isoform X3 [Sebastes fasciatus]|uniref:kinesin-like protein KIF13B isoform X3 n=1 Tax=Sebastes fasciatus TaxID=394691 RepID=UPI003D9E0D98
MDDNNSLNDSNVKVAVRVRPMNRREKDLKTKCVVEMEGNQTVLNPAITNVSKGDPRNQPKVFAYDHCFWSIDESEDDKFAGQDVVFQCLGESLLDNAFMGYNACIFAYGQTGSGKSYTMMGSAEQPGLIPRLSSSLFSRTVQEAREGESFTVEVSYMEIYNEKVRDLLDPKGNRQALRVREHKVMGPYVDGLSRLAVACYKDIESLMSEGNKSRTVAATNMNEESSRSHAVFNIILTHTLMDLRSETSGEKVSKLSLVDLAGSERAAKTGAAGERLKEGSNINKSLSTLGLVISALADQGAGKNRSKFVPYRDSVLTWLLKDSLGGNSRTAMVATISPSADNYDETLSTLRYADRAKSIVNHAVVNEDPNARIIRELREEVEKLKEMLTEAESMKAPELKDRLEESEKLIQEMTVTWEQKLRNTEAIAQERQRQLESLGISLQSSGIRVVDDKCFLVNLNADPALNELLVYYLKEHTRVGSADSQDIQLCGMAIQAEHCVIDITESNGVVLSPHRNARTCVNGAAVTSPVQLHHGDRILWGNNHFFRINLPRHMVHTGAEEEDEGGAAMKACLSSDRLEVDFDASSDVSSELSFGYEFAQAEVMMKGMGNNDPLQSVLQTLERQHEEEKRCALERQRQMYEQELQQLRRRLTPEKPSHLLDPTGLPASAAAAVTSPISHKRMRRWSKDREAMMTRSLRRLREQIVRANTLAQEAGFIAEELSKRTEYLVTLQIPAANLDANRKRDAVLSEPAIQVRRKGKGKQIWALEKMENRLVDMRELYQEWKDFDEDNPVMRSYFKRADPFFDEQENHSLIGVANVFLACLFYDVKLQYAVPIINQNGEVAARLHVEVWRGTEGSEDGGPAQVDTQLSNTDGDLQERNLDCVVKILQANGLPRHLSNFVFCQYHFWGQEEVVFIAPEMEPASSPSTSRDPQCTVVFDSTKELSVPMSEDFVEFLAEGAVAIEVYGHKQANHRRNLALWDLGVIQAKTRSLRERWSEVTRHLELWVQLMELNEAGDFIPVEVLPAAKDIRTGGVFQLRQGQSRRVQVEVRSVPDSGTMPLITASILSVSIGDVKIQQARLSKGGGSQWGGDEEMDSYQEVDLERMREQWLFTLTQRQEYLDQQLQKIVSKPDKSEDDLERESQLLECRLTLTEERNSVLVPSAGSGIPGAPVERVPVPGMETHIPVLFLDLSADDFQSSLSAPLAGGLDALLSGEEEDDFFDLHIVKHYDSEVKVEASWDSTVHESPQLSRVASADQRVYLTVSTVVQLSHPAHMQLVLRKRICVNVTGRQGFAQSLLKRMSQRSTIPGCGVTFEIVSNIPGDIHGPEDREMLARLAASTEDDQSADSEAAIEKYLRSVLAVENILTLDRLRQEVAVREQLAVRGKAPRRCLSSPNIHRGWDSHQDLSFVPPSSRRTLPSSITHNLNPETVHSGFVASHLPPVKAVPKLLKSLLPGGKEDGRDQTVVHQQVYRPEPEKDRIDVFDMISGGRHIVRSLPRIMVQSASVEEGLSKRQQLVPIEEIIPPVLQTESPRSVPLPPPIIPETEGSASSPVSEASSGYMSTCISTATLSDVYTLSWDLPPSSGSRTNGFEVVPDEEEENIKVTQSDAYPESFLVDQSEPQESLLVLDDKAAEERTDSPPSKPDDTPLDSNLSQQEAPSVQLKEKEEPDSIAESDLLCQTKQKQDSTIDPIGSEQLNNSEQLKDPLLVQDNETKQTEFSQTDHSRPETPLTVELELAVTDKTVEELELAATDKTEEELELAATDETEEELEIVATDKTEEELELAATDKTEEELELAATDKTEEELELAATDKTEEELELAATDKTEEELELAATDKTEEELKLPATDETEEELQLAATEETEEEFELAATDETEEELELAATDKTEEELELVATDKIEEEFELAATDETEEELELAATDKTEEFELAATDETEEELELAATDKTEEELELVATDKTEEELELAATDKTEAELSLHYERQPPAQEGQSQSGMIVPQLQQPEQDQTSINSAQDPAPNLVPVVSEVLVPAPAPSGDLVLLASSTEQATSEASNPNGTSISTSSSTTDEVQPANASKKASSAPAPSLTTVQPLKPDNSAANPFQIQKVKSSDLKSFKRIVDEDEDKPAQVDRASSLGTGLNNLSVPMESLEIISDSEEGDATAVLPDWLKEGEFVTVGNNKSGTVRYVGPTDFAQGTWVGVELEVPAGKNDGSVGGKHYFHCNPGYGVLVRPGRVSRAGSSGKRRRQQQKRRSANLSGSSPNLAALTALAKGDGGGASSGRGRGENRKSWNT